MIEDVGPWNSRWTWLKIIAWCVLKIRIYCVTTGATLRCLLSTFIRSDRFHQENIRMHFHPVSPHRELLCVICMICRPSQRYFIPATRMYLIPANGCMLWLASCARWAVVSALTMSSLSLVVRIGRVTLLTTEFLFLLFHFFLRTWVSEQTPEILNQMFILLGNYGTISDYRPV